MAALQTILLRLHIRLYSLLVPLIVRLPFKLMLAVNDPPSWLKPYTGLAVSLIQSAVHRCLQNPRMMRRRKCLRHGLVLHHFLKLAGYNPQLHFGVYPAPDSRGKLHGHCWVCLGGQPVSPPPSDDLATVHVGNLN